MQNWIASMDSCVLAYKGQFWLKTTYVINWIWKRIQIDELWFIRWEIDGDSNESQGQTLRRECVYSVGNYDQRWILSHNELIVALWIMNMAYSVV